MSGVGCIFCMILFVLGFSHYGWWILLGFILWASSNNSTSSSSNSSLNQSSQKNQDLATTVFAGVPDDIDNILRELSMGDIKDPVTLDKFRPGETVYLCHVHRLAYHEDSWRSVGCQCDVCGNNSHVKQYTVPLSIPIRQRDISHLIQFRDLDE
ncbi:hypothetical protein [Planktothrix agardhii]|uniref:hypothetical protein n=1 Tax=Planktothrix agardhii TaxID=1160 RepID=UPI002875A399|nr:hypothetical protein [Planktothrix agardhii]MDS1345193.1 hypothetical protein [Planktothrix agardhii NRERC-751]